MIKKCWTLHKPVEGAILGEREAEALSHDRRGGAEK